MIGWELVYEGYEPAEEGTRETLCTLGNGYFATRGAAPEAVADGTHYPGVYIAACYNRLRTEIEGRLLENEDLVNAPNWLGLRFRPADGEWVDLESVEILSYRQVLDLRRGMLRRDMRVRDRRGRTTRVASRCLVHMADPHLAALEIELTAEDWSGPIEVCSMLDGRVENRGVPRYRALAARHLVPVAACACGEDAELLVVRTVQSQIRIVEAARTRVFEDTGRRACRTRTVTGEGFAARELSFDVVAGRPVTIEKVVSLYTSRDRAISTPELAASAKLAEAPDLDELVETHVLAWEHLWRSFDIELEADGHDEITPGVILRLHVLHLLQTASHHTADLDAGVGARGLHGEAYKGHVFWDELFVFPLLNLRSADITRSLLLYRFRRLEAARRAARAAGYRGAMYPWQSGSEGREETPTAYFNPRSGRWIPDHTRLQRHVGAAIAFNVWQYYQATGDLQFLGEAGAEMMLEIARFFASAATHDPDRDRFEILGVMGPDEFHSQYPWASRPGLDNNAYTNVMAVWTLWRARDALELLPHDRRLEIRERLGLTHDELARWDAISRTMYLPFLDGGILAQFEGYDRLSELDWDGYRARYSNIQRLDLILESEDDSPNRYKASKQADVLMLFYLFSSEELGALFARLGYSFDPQSIPRTIDYYLRRTSDGSTLSRVAHAWVLARSDRAASWELCKAALSSDIADIQDGTTREGIHLGAMAGSVDLVHRCYTGLELRDGVLWVNPRLPDPMRRLLVLVRYRGHTLELVMTRDAVDVSAERSEIPSIKIAICGAVHVLSAGERRRFSLTEERGRAARSQSGPA